MELTVQLSDLAIETGDYLGFGRTPSEWQGWDVLNPYKPKDVQITLGAGTQTVSANNTQLGRIMARVNDGLSKFYAANRWTFKEPTLSLTTTSGIGQYQLPDDFADIDGRLVYDPTAQAYATLVKCGETFIRDKLQMYQGTNGKPVAYAILVRRSDGVLGQRSDILFYPTPDGTYLLRARYIILPTALTVTNPYPLATAEHRQCLIESCKSECEGSDNDEETVHEQKYQQLLALSIEMDGRKRPEMLGYCGDNSDTYDDAFHMRHLGVPTITYNGLPIPQ